MGPPATRSNPGKIPLVPRGFVRTGTEAHGVYLDEYRELRQRGVASLAGDAW